MIQIFFRIKINFNKKMKWNILEYFEINNFLYYIQYTFNFMYLYMKKY